MFMKIPQGFSYDPVSGKLVQHTYTAFMDQRHFIKLKYSLLWL